MIFDIEPLTCLRTSSPRAVSPPTLTSACWANAEAGTTESRRRSTSATAASDSLGALGVTWTRTLSPA